MDWSGVQQVLKDEPAFRLKQVRKAIFVDCIDDWNAVTVLPKQMREKLAVECPLTIQADQLVSADGNTVKALITLADGKRIETVCMRHGDRNTVCVSTLVGCPMGCTFCATGTMGMVRKLTADEIVEQVLYFARYLKGVDARSAGVVSPRDRSEGASPQEYFHFSNSYLVRKIGRPVLVSRGNASAPLRAGSKPKNSEQYVERVGSVVFMGMGEPFLNYEAVMGAIRMLHDKDTFNIGARHISISTCGILDGIKRLADEDLPVNLAISLHASNDETRAKLMPIARTYPMSELLATVDAYIAKTNRKVMFEQDAVRGHRQIHADEESGDVDVDGERLIDACSRNEAVWIESDDFHVRLRQVGSDEFLV
jgi:23S rRNA (adenine2503-C2)-methyltransferase